MLTILIIAVVFGAARGLLAIARSWRDLPHSNEDMVYF